MLCFAILKPTFCLFNTSIQEYHDVLEINKTCHFLKKKVVFHALLCYIKANLSFIFLNFVNEVLFFCFQGRKSTY